MSFQSGEFDVYYKKNRLYGSDIVNTTSPQYMIYTTLTHREADQLQDFIHQQHLNAFISMLSTTEVFGKGFNHT